MEKLDIKIGHKKGRLTIISVIDNGKFFETVCECGTKKLFKRGNLLHTKVKSCGCIRKEKSAERQKITKEKAIQFLKERHVKNAKTGCWEWTGYLTGNRYAGMRYENETKAHRVSYIVFNGPITKKDVIRHTCDNPICVNPEHLLIGTQQDNINDMDNRGRRNPPKGIRNIHAKATFDQVQEMRIRFANGEHFRKLMKEYGYKSHSSFYSIINYKTRKET